MDVISTPQRREKLTELEPGWEPGFWAGGCSWCWFRLSLSASCYSQACVSLQQLCARNMATDWLGSIVSINCGESLGVYQGRVSAVDQVSQTISLTRPFHNGVKCLVPEVTFRLVSFFFPPAFFRARSGVVWMFCFGFPQKLALCLKYPCCCCVSLHEKCLSCFC